MSFTTPEFLLLFAATCLLYFNLTRTGQNIVVLIAGLVFYAWWDWRFLFLIFATTAADYVCALGIAASTTERRRKMFLVAAIAVNLSVLALFKYLDFIVRSVTQIASWAGGKGEFSTIGLLLPLGISFYTFHALSYAVDVYRGKAAPERNYLIYLSYVMFFPLLVAGPIERAWHLIPQFKRDRHVTPDMVRSGLLLCASGFFKKLVIADNVAAIANYGFGTPSASGASHLVAIYAFAFQIYCDFSGYSDIAAGTARILGFEVFQNFNLPYLTTNPREFWRAWHISLSTWFRDYVYIPLGGNRVSRWKTLRNLAITMLLCGLWHGAAWIFVVWGAYHGVMFVVYDVWSQTSAGRWVTARNDTFSYAIKVVVFFQFVCLGWLLFRADSVAHALGMLRNIAFHFAPDASALNLAAKLVVVAVPLVLTQIFQKRFGMAPWDRWELPSQAVAVGAAIVLIALLGAPIRTPFIYFQF
jgi:D-alanyl-lipoteichoic acid acyltransferase DltB (MBOAT superfamily)